MFNSHLWPRWLAVSTRIVCQPPADTAQSFIQQIVFAKLGREGERSANATLITTGRALKGNFSSRRRVDTRSADAALIVNLAAAAAGELFNELADLVLCNWLISSLGAEMRKTPLQRCGVSDTDAVLHDIPIAELEEKVAEGKCDKSKTPLDGFGQAAQA